MGGDCRVRVENVTRLRAHAAHLGKRLGGSCDAAGKFRKEPLLRRCGKFIAPLLGEVGHQAGDFSAVPIIQEPQEALYVGRAADIHGGSIRYRETLARVVNAGRDKTREDIVYIRGANELANRRAE